MNYTIQTDEHADEATGELEETGLYEIRDLDGEVIECCLTAEQTREHIIRDCVAAGKKEVTELKEGGAVPENASISGSPSLHDYIDANTLGGVCDDDFSEAMRLLGYKWMDEAEGVSAQIDEWIRG